MLRCTVLTVASLVFASTLAITMACTSESEREVPAEPPRIKTAPAEEAEPAAPADTATTEPALARGSAYITTVTWLRKEPTGDRRIESPEDAKKKVSNWIATLHTGESVDIIERVDDEWTRVRASDDSEGHIQSKFLLPAEETTLVTVYADTKIFRRPDLLTLNSSREIETASLLFKVKEKDQFTEVRNGYLEDWVLTEKLISDEREVEAAKLLAKARWMQAQKDEGYIPLMELIESQFGDTKTYGAAEDANSVGDTDESENEGEQNDASGSDEPEEDAEANEESTDEG